jgi:hypothetical protein
MNLLYFNTNKNRAGQDVSTIFKSYVPNLNICDCNDFNAFSMQLIESKGNNTMAVIFIADEEELMELYGLKHLLYKVIPVLILPDEERDTIAVGFRCKPLFMTTIHHAMTEIECIVQMLTAQPNQPVSYDDVENYERAA